MNVRQLVRRPPVTVSPRSTVARAATLMEQESVGMLVVVSGGKVAGVVTDRDLVVRGFAHGAPPDEPPTWGV